MSPITLPAVGLALVVAFEAIATYLDYRIAKEVGR